MDWSTIVLTSASILFGGAITFLASWRYYRKASEDLRREAGALRQETTEIRRETAEIRTEATALRGRSEELLRYVLVLIDLLDNAGVVEAKRNPRTGEILAARLLRTTHSATAKGVASYDWKVIPGKGIPAGDRSVAEHILRDFRAEEQDDG